MTGGDTARKNTLELAILEHGGKVVQNCGTDTWCCVVTEERNIRVRHIVSGGNYNVVRAAWLERCVARKTLLEWTPDEVIFFFYFPFSQFILGLALPFSILPFHTLLSNASSFSPSLKSSAIFYLHPCGVVKLMYLLKYVLY